MGQKRLPGIAACAGVVTGGIVQNVEPDLFVRLARQPGMGTGVVWPERASVTGLPAVGGLGRSFVAGVGGELVFASPAADAGAVGAEIKAAALSEAGGLEARRLVSKATTGWGQTGW